MKTTCDLTSVLRGGVNPLCKRQAFRERRSDVKGVGFLTGAMRLFALAAISLAATSAMAAANYWKGADGADLAVAANWTESALPTSDAGYINGRAEHGTDFTATLSGNLSLYQLIWGGNNPVARSTVLDLGGNTLTLTVVSSARPIRIEEDDQSVTITNGTVTFSSTETALLLGNNETLTLGEGLIFNGYAALNGAAARSGNTIVVKDGAKVNGKLDIAAYQTGGTILVTGDGTEVAYGSVQFKLPTATTSSNSVFRVADGATVNTGSGQNAQVANNGETEMELSVESGATFKTGDNAVDSGKWLCLGKSGVVGGNKISVGDEATIQTRVFQAVGTGNTVAISNGTFTVGAYAQFGRSATDAITLKFAGSSPHLHVVSTTHETALFAGTPTLVFDIPAEGYTTIPITRGNSIEIPDTAQLVVNARDYVRAGGGTLTLMSVTGSNKTLTAPETLLTRWNAELGSTANVSVVDGNKLVLTVKQPGLTIIFK